MPPSPALRYSPRREHRAENHKRGRSFEGALRLREKDDDLALFNDMQSKERENFLLQSSDDLEDTFSTKLRQFSDFKLGISIPVRGESSELLNVEGEKNDYDWLLTPPDTPLFPSLDDEPQPVNVLSRGRPRSQPITISRSSTMEKSYKSSRGSASPNRLSPSPGSGSSSLQSRGRPSSAPLSSPTQCQRPAAPSHRSSPPLTKPSTPAPRSSTPTYGRTSTGSGTRGISPVRTNRGNSASPKIRAWQSNIPGFSSEAPSNLRTSLTDRPGTYVRGSSPASRNGSYKYGRQSMSPTASRSVSSSHSQDRDRISSNSRGSVASSGDDDIDSLQSVHVGSLDRFASKRTGMLSSNRNPALSKKSTRILSPSSAPKRFFDSALRQMDHRKSPQNMFRPLLSSVPSSSFYVGKASSVQRPLMSRNSSVTTSSNASSDQCTTVAIDAEGSDHHHDDMAVESRKTVYSDAHEEVFAFDKADALNEDVEHDTDDGLVQFHVDDFDGNQVTEFEPNNSKEFSHQEVDTEVSSASGSVRADFAEVDSHQNVHVCSKCGRRYRVIETVEKEVNLCSDCRRQGSLMAASNSDKLTVASGNAFLLSGRVSDEHEPFDKTELAISGSQLQVLSKVGAEITQQGHSVKLKQKSFHEHSHTFSQEIFLTRALVEEDEQRFTSQPGTGQASGSHRRSGSDSGGQNLVHSNDFHSLRMDISEGSGISVLLKRPNSSKGPVVRSRTFVASSITYDDFSYVRDSANGHGSISASSSIDLSSSRQVQRQLSGKKPDVENYRYDISSRPQTTVSSLSGISNHNHRAIGLATSTREENSEAFVGDMQRDGIEIASVTSRAQVVASENNELSVSDASFTDRTPEQNSCELNESNRIIDGSILGLSSNPGGSQLEEKSVALFPNSGHCLSHENEDLPNNSSSTSDVEAQLIPPDASAGIECAAVNSNLDRLNDAGVPPHNSSASITEIETEDHCQSTLSLENDDISVNSKMTMNEFQDSSIPTQPDKGACSVMERINSGHQHGMLEDSTVMLQEGSKSRSLTLEEATDTILFCSSIVHDLAYQAATIAIEKEDSIVPLEGSWPTVTILGKSTADGKDSRSRTPVKRGTKSPKAKQKRAEVDVKSPSRKTENDENDNESMARNAGLPNNMDSTKPPKLESKCNCAIM